MDAGSAAMRRAFDEAAVKPEEIAFRTAMAPTWKSCVRPSCHPAAAELGRKLLGE